MRRSVISGAGGLLYGGVLSLIGLLLGVEGNTSNWMVISSPFAGLALLGTRHQELQAIPADTFGWMVIGMTALFWAALFATASAICSRRGKVVVISSLVVHYVVLVTSLIYLREGSDRPSAVFVSVYLLGQIYLWWELTRKRGLPRASALG